MTFSNVPPEVPETPDSNDAPSADVAQPTPVQETWGPPASPEGPNPAIRQLEAMLADLTTYARPVLREIAARAAELAAKAAEAAGPAVQKAADATDQVGGRVATKGREIAADLRRDSETTSHDSDGPTASSASR